MNGSNDRAISLFLFAFCWWMFSSPVSNDQCQCNFTSNPFDFLFSFLTIRLTLQQLDHNPNPNRWSLIILVSSENSLIMEKCFIEFLSFRYDDQCKTTTNTVGSKSNCWSSTTNHIYHWIDTTRWIYVSWTALIMVFQTWSIIFIEFILINWQRSVV